MPTKAKALPFNRARFSGYAEQHALTIDKVFSERGVSAQN
jgi:hypothetical protein